MEQTYTFKSNKMIFKKLKTKEFQLEIGQVIRFCFFSNITFEGFNEKGEVVLKDSAGNKQFQPVWIFEKYIELL